MKTQRNKLAPYMLVDTEKNNSACVIGNGPSRLRFDLHEINAVMTTYGANALYRDFMPDHLISVDIPMIYEILNKNVHRQTKLYIQGHSQFDNHEHRDHYNIIHYGYKEGLDSGNSALLVCCQNGHKDIYMIGFDYSIYNVYSKTVNYNEFSHVTLPPTWQRRLCMILDRYKDRNITRVVGNDVMLDVIRPNYKQITVEQFKEIVNEL